MPEASDRSPEASTTLPGGTLTFLFTDIEGSTRLLQALGERYGEVLARHHAILREVLVGQNAIEVGTEGDAFFIVFSQVSDAINTAVRAQRKLHDHDWGPGTEVAVRMGIHTGEARRLGDRYVGIDVHRAARIAGAAHGGQILLSRLTAEHVRSSSAIGPGVRLVELGDFRLKDLEQPEHLFQLNIDGLPGDFPPPSTLEHPLELPRLAGSFVRRDKEQREIVELLRSDRLVTLTGPGGTGKTRLAVEVARHVSDEFSGGTFFVPLAPIDDYELVAGTIARALRIALEAKETFDRLENWFGQGLADFILYQVERLAGNHEEALRMMIASLDLPGVSGDASSMTSLIEMMADSLIALGHPRLGLRLAAGADRAGHEYGGGAPPALLELDDPRELGRTQLAEDEIDAAWAEGAHLSLDEIVALARKGGEA